jgi:hypothetical protein
MAEFLMVGDQNEELGSAQQMALAALRSGQSFARAAEGAGVHRATVFRWVNTDPRFAAAYNAWKGELAASAQVRLLKLADKAVDVVEKALERGNEKVAMKMLRHLAVLRRPRVGTTDAEALAVEMDLRERQRDLGHAQGMAKFILDKAGFTPADQKAYLRKHGLTGMAKQMKEISQSRAREGQEAIDREGEPSVLAVGPENINPRRTSASSVESQSRSAPVAMENGPEGVAAPSTESQGEVIAAPNATVHAAQSPEERADRRFQALKARFDATDHATVDATERAESHESSEVHGSQDLSRQEVA